MLTRYQIRRGARADDLPAGVRQDTRKHTKHPLRPAAEDVEAYLGGRSTWREFATRYRERIDRRMKEDPEPFERLAALAARTTVHLGCSCPTKRIPDVRRCHTWLALELMADRFPGLEVRFPTDEGVDEG